MIGTSKFFPCCQLQMHLSRISTLMHRTIGCAVSHSFLTANPNFSFLQCWPCPQFKTKRSCTRILVYVGITPISWSSKSQSLIQTSKYGVEIIAGKIACIEAIPIKYMLRYLGVRFEGPTILYGDNEGMLQSSSLIDLK